MTETKEFSEKFIGLPDELAKCQLCGTSDMIICMQKDKTIKGLPVTENKIICLPCVEKQARQDAIGEIRDCQDCGYICPKHLKEIPKFEALKKEGEGK